MRRILTSKANQDADAQGEYAEGKLQVSNSDSSRKAISSLLEKYRKANGNIVHVTHKVPDGAPVFTPGTKLAEEFEELTPKEGEKTIQKVHPGSFADTDLDNYLKESGAKKIVLTGYMVRPVVMTRREQSWINNRSGTRLRLHDCQTRSSVGIRCCACRRCNR